MESRYKKNRGYTYGSMIVAQDDTTVSELTEGIFHEWNDKLEIMGSICDFYDYSWRFYPDGRLVLSDFLNEDSEWRGENDYGHFEYQSSEEIYDDSKENGTGGILNLCDQLYEKIDKYLEG